MPLADWRRDDGGKCEKSGSPDTTRFAPSQEGSNWAIHIPAEICSMSSWLTILSCRTLDISVPLSCCCDTRTSENRVLPLWALPSTPFQSIFIKDRASVCSSTDLRCVTTPSHTIWAEYSVATSAVISLYFTKNNLFRQGM